MTNPRRRSNSFHTPQQTVKTKFETIEPEPVFEEELHGPPAADAIDDAGAELEKASTGSSSVEDEDLAMGKKM